MLWILAFHVIFVICWFAGLFYLPRLYVYHAMSTDQVSIDRFKIMERKLFWGIMTPSGVLATIFGLWILIAEWQTYMLAGWMHLKIFFVILLWVYHVICWKFLQDFKYDRPRFSHKFYRLFNEVPVVLLIVIVILVIVKP